MGTQTCNLVGLLTIGLVSFLASIAAIAMVSILIHNSASDQLDRLVTATALLEQKVVAAEQRVPEAQQCQTNLAANTTLVGDCALEALHNCTDNAVEIAAKTQALQSLMTETIVSVQAYLDTVLTTTCAQIVTLQQAITEADANATMATPARVLEGGNVTVEMEGGDAYPTTYDLYQLTVGGVRTTYLELSPWPISLSVLAGTPNPKVTFHDFSPSVTPTSPVASSCGVTRPLLVSQANRMAWSNPALTPSFYEWTCDHVNGTRLEITSAGTSIPGYTFHLGEKLKVMGQFF